MAALLLALLLHGALHGAQAGDVVLVGLSNRRGGERALRSRPQSAADRPCNCRQCNAAGRLNLDGKHLEKALQDSPGACCAACKLRADCNVWTWCGSKDGCDAGGRFQECSLKQDYNVWKYKQVISNGYGWLSGYIASRCPSTDPSRLLALQRVSFPSFTKQCQPGSSCTACMCQLSNAMTVSKSNVGDLSLCLQNFRNILMFPSLLGGSSLSSTAYQRLQQCPVADPPSPGKDLACFSNKSERDCGFACVSTSGCDGFMYALQGSGYCCLKSGPSGQAKLSDNGEQMYFKMKAGATAEDYFFSQRSPWGGGSPAAPSTSTTASTLAQPVSNSASTSSLSSGTCSQKACNDTAPPAYSCSQHAAWGKCREDWMKPYCNRSCKRCSNCGDTPPPAYSCSQQAAWGKCREDWMKPYCNRSCKRCGDNCGSS